MLKKPSAILVLASTLLFVVAPPALSQQNAESNGIIDGITVGIGLSKLFGEVDAVMGVSAIQHIAQSHLHLMAGVDRDLEHFRLGLDGNYQRFDGRHEMGAEAFLTLDVDVFSVDLIASRGFDLLRPNYFRIYGGIGGSFASPNYNVDGPLLSEQAHPDDQIEEGSEEYEQIMEGEQFWWEDANISFRLRGNRAMVSFPIGVMIQDRLRLGVRIFGHDYLDGVRADGSPWDYLTNITIGWRFEL